MWPRSRITFALFSGHHVVTRRQKLQGLKIEMRVTAELYTHWKIRLSADDGLGVAIHWLRMQCNLTGRALACPVFFTGIAPEPLNAFPGLLDLRNFLQNPCAMFAFPFCRRITKLKIDIGNHGTVPLQAEGPCVGGGCLLSSTGSLWCTGFSFHLLSYVWEFYRCLASSTPFMSPPVDMQINSYNGIFA